MNKKKAVLMILFILSGSLWGCSSHVIRLESSYWRYSDDDISYEFLFRPDGHIYSYHPNDATPENDFWKQRGKRVAFSMNDHYASYKGKLINDTTIVGKGRSKGFRWTWTAKFISKN